MRVVPVFVLVLAMSLACGSSTEEAVVEPPAAPTEASPKPTLAAEAPEDEVEQVELREAWMVITATHTSKADSEAAFPDGAPWPGQLWDTNKVEGLKPGLWVRSPLITLQEEERNHNPGSRQ